MGSISNINADLLLAATSCISNEETRYYLRGVFVEKARGGGLLYTATDGHRLFHAHDAGAVMDDGENCIISFAKPITQSAWFKTKVLQWDGKVLSNLTGELLMAAHPIDGVFPRYKSLIPTQVNNETAHFNYDYLAGFQSMSKRANLGLMRLHHNGGDPAVISFSDSPHVVSVVMPLRVGERDIPILPAVQE